MDCSLPLVLCKSFKNDRYSFFLWQCTVLSIIWFHYILSIRWWASPHHTTIHQLAVTNKEIYEHSCIHLCVNICFIRTFSHFSLASTQVCAVGIDGLQVKILFTIQIWQWHSYFIVNLSPMLSKWFQRDRNSLVFLLWLVCEYKTVTAT